MSNQRVKCSLQRFLQVTIKERDQYPTVDEAAKATGLTPLSFQQRLVRERKRYPQLYADIPSYRGGGNSRIPTQEEAAALLQ